MNQYVIEIDHAKKMFGDEVVLNDVCLKMESGKIYGIVGYNGSGKTVLFKCICGFYHLDAGQIRINGKVLGKDLDMIEDAGIIIEEPAYIRTLSGFKNLDLLYRINHKPDRAQIERAMEQVGLNPKLRKKVGHYSLGMRQRLAIAQATMENQKVLILDEPMNGLDKNGVRQMRKFFENKRAEGKLIIMASHNNMDIEQLCDKVYELENGSLQKKKEEEKQVKEAAREWKSGSGQPLAENTKGAKSAFLLY